MTSRSRLCSRAAALTLAVLALLAMAAPAYAHTEATRTSPVDGAVLQTSPGRVSVTFGDEVASPVAELKVYDRSSSRVDLEPSYADPADERTIIAELGPELADGDYVVIWRAVSYDGHTVIGSFTFAVGERPAAAAVAPVVGPADGGRAALEELAAQARSDAEPSGGVAASGLAMRIAVNLGTLLVAGAAAFLVLVLRRRDRASEQQAVRRWIRGGAQLTVVATLASLPVQAAAVAGTGVLAALTTEATLQVLVSPFGIAALVRLIALGPLAAQRVEAGAGSVAALGGIGLASLAVDGHSVTQGWLPLMLAADVAHLSAGAVWFGGLIALLAVFRQLTLDRDARGAAEVVAGFSGVAAYALVGVTTAGLLMARTLVGTPSALFTTPYGRVLLTKSIVVLLVALLGGYNRRFLLPRVERVLALPAGGAVDAPDVMVASSVGADDRAWRALARTVRVEVVGIVIALALTGWLTGLSPAAGALAG